MYKTKSKQIIKKFVFIVILIKSKLKTIFPARIRLSSRICNHHIKLSRDSMFRFRWGPKSSAILSGRKRLAYMQHAVCPLDLTLAAPFLEVKRREKRCHRKKTCFFFCYK